MKYALNYIFMIFIVLSFIVCSKDDSAPIVDSLITTTPAIGISLIPTVSIFPTNLAEEETPKSENSNIDEYQICGLTINDTEETIIDKLGKPKHNLDYYLYDGVAWAELRRMMRYDGLTIRTGKQLKMSVDDEDGDYLLSEIDIFTPEYATYRGIIVGDSFKEVEKAYKNLENYTYLDMDTSLEGDMIYRMLMREDRPKINGDDGYESDFTYGEYEKIAYIYAFDEENPIRPSLIFLFHNDMVTHIILYHWLYEVI